MEVKNIEYKQGGTIGKCRYCDNTVNDTMKVCPKCGNNINFPDRKQYFSCACNGEVLMMEYDPNEKYQELSFVIYRYGKHPHKRRLINRLAYAIHHIFTGEIFQDEIIIEKKDVIRMKEYLNKIK